MFLSAQDLWVVAAVVLLATPAGAGVALMVGRWVGAGSRELAAGARAIGGAGYRAGARPATAELAAIARELDSAHRRLGEAAGGGGGPATRPGGQPPPAGRLGQPRPAYPPGRAAGDDRGPRGRDGRRSGGGQPVPPADPGRGRPALRHGGEPVRTVPHPGLAA